MPRSGSESQRRRLSAKKFGAQRNEENKVKNESFDFHEAPRRIDLRDKVTGVAQYVEDLPDLPNTAYGATLLSPYSHARILSIDTSQALRMPGVLGIVDRDHLDGVNP